MTNPNQVHHPNQVPEPNQGPNPKIVSLSVRPSQVSQLCFETGGILGECKAELGAPVVAFNFAGFYALLGSIPTIPDHPARMLYDFLEIQAFVGPFTLASLRAEGAKATLNQAINARANAFYAKYGNASLIIDRISEVYNPNVQFSKPDRLKTLVDLSEAQRSAISGAYVADKRAGVVKMTMSNLVSTSQSGDKSGAFVTGSGIFQAEPASAPSFTVGGNTAVTEDIRLGRSSTSETVMNTDYGYRHPFYETEAQYQRAQISLIDEQFAQFIVGLNTPFLGAVFQNELDSINGDVYRTQIAYLNTILMSPISGIVTGIYKNLGDAVKAGETVIRVENNMEIFLVATLIYPGPISVGSKVTITTTLFGSPKDKVTTEGTAVAVRGQREDDQWEVIVKCSNLDDDGKPIYPLGYHFDYDDTTVSIT